MYNLNSGYAQPPFFLESFQGVESDSLSLEQFNSMDQLEPPTGVYHTGSFDLNTLDPSLVQGPSSLAQLHNQQALPMAKFINEPQRPLFTMPQLYTNQALPGMPRTSAPVNTLPYANQGRIASPSPSQGLTSTCSSALSPPADSDYSQDSTFYSPLLRPRDEFASFGGSSQFNINQGPGSWSGQSLQTFSPQQFGQNVNCVQLSQVQSVPDAEEMIFEDGYGIGGQEYSVAMNDGHTIHVASSRQDSFFIDEGIGSSTHDNPTPKSTVASYHDQEGMDEEDVDAEGDTEQDIVVVEPADDGDYTPNGKPLRRNKTRRSAKTFNPLSANTKNARVTKPTSKAKGTYECKTCDAGPFKDPSSLAKHTATAHTRAFACVFKFAGCDSTFGSKNEWKRHVQSQHLNMTAWLCTQGSCGKTHGPKGNPTIGSEFNRKDLFTQHVRRMHVPPGTKKKQKSANGKDIPDPDFEAHLKKLQVSCLVIKRQGPEKLRCPVYGCDHVFQGQNPWDERMEHVGKHVEKGKGTKVDIRSERDDMLVVWALREGVIERKSNGGYRLGVSGVSASTAQGHANAHSHSHIHDDEDAEGEADD